MQIKVDPGYRGPRTGEKFIEPGTYDINDPALFGAGEYLLQSGRAVEVGSPQDKAQKQRAVDRDLAGRPIDLNVKGERVSTPPTLAVYEHPANRLGAEDMPPLDVYTNITGVGVVVPGTVMSSTQDAPAETSSEPQGLAAMTVPQLRDYATAIGMDVEGLSTQDALITAIDAYMVGQAGPNGQPVDLDAMTVDQLKDFASEQGFNIKGLTKKGELVAAIGKQLNEADEA